MTMRTVKWGVFAASSLIGAFACSGTNLNEVGELGTAAGHAGSEAAGAQGSQGGAVGRAGAPMGEAGTGGGFETTAGGEGVPLAHAGAGGEAGGNGDAGAGGDAGQPNNGDLLCPTCTVVATDRDIRGVAANEQQVFWVDYGTKDKLGNYQNDGRLLARSLDGGPVSVLADSLAGPESVSVSASYAYVFLDQRDAVLPLGVIRIPLTGGPSQPLQGLANATWFSYQVFASTADYEYWTWGGAVYRIAQTDGASVEPFLQRQAGPLFADDALLYFTDVSAPDAGAWTAPLTGSVATQLSAAPNYLLQLQGDYLYGTEVPQTAEPAASYLTRMPKAGGAWKRLATITTSPSQLAVVGDTLFSDEPTDSRRQILRRTFGPDTTTVVASEAIPASSSWAWNGWALSRIGLFFADPNGLYITPTPTP